MKDEDGNGLAYARTLVLSDVERWAIYEMWLEDRVILEVVINEADPQLEIFMGKPGLALSMEHAGGSQSESLGILATGISASMALHTQGEGEDVTVLEHVDGIRLQMFTYALLPKWLADVYVPKAKVS